MNARLRTQVFEMARRSLLQTLRQPAMIVPPVVFPLFLLAVNVGGLDAATGIPGFPTDSYLNFAISFAFMQGSLFAMINAGTQLARDVQDGFLKRLALTPMQRAALLVGNLAGVITVALFSSFIYLAVGFAAGMEVASGVGGVVVLIALTLLVAVSLSALGALVGLRTGNAEAVQGFFPMFFVLFFLSSQNMPRELIEVDWFRIVATYNPVSYLIEAVRSLIITGWDGEALALGVGLALLTGVLSIAGASAALRTRLVRT